MTRSFVISGIALALSFLAAPVVADDIGVGTPLTASTMAGDDIGVGQSADDIGVGQAFDDIGVGGDSPSWYAVLAEWVDDTF